MLGSYFEGKRTGYVALVCVAGLAFAAACSAGSAATGGGAGNGPQGAGSSSGTTPHGGSSGLIIETGGSADAGADGAVASNLEGPVYVPNCSTATCTTATWACVPGPNGNYCAHPCPGQICPPDAGAVPYCDITGGVVNCLAK